MNNKKKIQRGKKIIGIITRDNNVKRDFIIKENNFKGRKYDSEKEEKVGNKSKENSVNKNFRGGFAKKEGGQCKFEKEC